MVMVVPAGMDNAPLPPMTPPLQVMEDPVRLIAAGPLCGGPCLFGGCWGKGGGGGGIMGGGGPGGGGGGGAGGGGGGGKGQGAAPADDAAAPGHGRSGEIDCGGSIERAALHCECL